MFILFFILYITSLCNIVLVCNPFNCLPYSNNVLITYRVQPSPSLTYNTIANPAPTQQLTRTGLEIYLSSLGQQAISNAINNLPLVARNYVTITATISQLGSQLLDIEINPGLCTTTTQEDTVVAAAGTYFLKNNLIFTRTTPTICNNGQIVSQGQGVPLTISLVYQFQAIVPIGQILCMMHWQLISNELENIIRGTNSIVLVNGQIMIG
uniref:CHRD domain-containing protein n=1 Tax=Parastrongyloides trichosuri TaxID=131310 RepID=A0A0N4ZXM4_PARTI